MFEPSAGAGLLPVPTAPVQNGPRPLTRRYRPCSGRVQIQLVIFQTQGHIVNRADFHLFPALLTNIDHTTVHTHPLDLSVVGPGWCHLKAFWADLALLVLGLCQQLGILCLGLSLQTTVVQRLATHSPKDRHALLIGQQPTQPHHLLGHFPPI